MPSPVSSSIAPCRADTGGRRRRRRCRSAARCRPPRPRERPARGPGRRRAPRPWPRRHPAGEFARSRPRRPGPARRPAGIPPTAPAPARPVGGNGLRRRRTRSGSVVGSAIWPAIAAASRSSAAPQSSPARSHSPSRSTHAVTRQAGEPSATSTASPSPRASRATQGKPASSASNAIWPSRADGSSHPTVTRSMTVEASWASSRSVESAAAIVLDSIENRSGPTEVPGQQGGDAAARAGHRHLLRRPAGRADGSPAGEQPSVRPRCRRRRVLRDPVGRRPAPAWTSAGSRSRGSKATTHRPDRHPTSRHRPFAAAALPELRFVQQALGLPERIDRRAQRAFPHPAPGLGQRQPRVVLDHRGRQQQIGAGDRVVRTRTPGLDQPGNGAPVLGPGVGPHRRR